MLHSSGTSARPFLLKPSPSRWLLGWWLLLHSSLVAAVYQMHLSVLPGVVLGCLVGLHAGLRYPRRCPLIVVCPGGRLALPAEGRFDLRLAPATRVGAFWVELVFDDEEGSRQLLIRDQFTDSAWRELRLALFEWI